MAAADIISLTDQIKQEVSFESSTSGHSHARLLRLVDELKLAIETPTETVLRLIYQVIALVFPIIIGSILTSMSIKPPENAALRTVVDLGIFPILVKDGQKNGLSAADLAVCTGADKGLIVRLMRVMTALGLCASTEAEVYRPTDKSLSMTQPIGQDGIPCIYDLTVPTLTKLPEYLREHNYSNPEEYSSSPMKWAVGQSQFEWLAKNKRHQALFNSYMSSRREGKPNWLDVYPLERLVDGTASHPDSVFLVDIGGNQGHDLGRLMAQHRTTPGRVILQDLPKIVSTVNRPGIEAMGYSFLDPQPIKGARAYYFRAIFHDWPDRICHKILLNTASAMDPTYSRIIIVDFVLPDTNAPRMQSAMDIQMMSIGAGVERSKRQWTELLASAGLKINGIWNTSPGMESIIEAVLDVGGLEDSE
ncbi:uncharacterized protein N7511_004743 [Penicillium nucicola]|uniref:uncharacterized protein n=1 Tax=Penicillium nucicola TaxID=1850975 RepID=UPI0025458331|nr:uncharacterized protein N7511_004743 [Penicillium nucicola]KAJ5767127.1 hypothetical protein N7511_004743 [Penicillium nucicola]